MKKTLILLAAVFMVNTMSAFAEDTTPKETDTQTGVTSDVISEDATQPKEEVKEDDTEPSDAQTPDTPATPTEPAIEVREASIVLNGTALSFTLPAIMKNGQILVPFEEMTRSLELAYDYSDGTAKAFSPSRTLSVDALLRAYIGGVLQTPVAPPEIISEKLFVPAALFIQAFNMESILNTQNTKPVLYLGTASTENIAGNNSYVNSLGLSSSSYYLIWISKNDFTVRVFLGGQGHWEQIKAFTCAIGAPGTPTCEGTYKYYQAQARWDFGSYYVGPVMRFNGGYAMHSTLINPNGTPKDNRVGMRLSHGCVRLRPEDIGWLFYYIPLGTTIHITG